MKQLGNHYPKFYNDYLQEDFSDTHLCWASHVCEIIKQTKPLFSEYLPTFLDF